MPDTSKMELPDKIDALQTAILQTHGCLESHREEMRGSMQALSGELGGLRAAIAINNGVTEALAKRLNVNVDVKETGEVQGIEKVKAAVGAWSMKKVIFVGLPLFAGFIGFLQFAFLVTPGVAKAIYDAVMKMPS